MLKYAGVHLSSFSSPLTKELFVAEFGSFVSLLSSLLSLLSKPMYSVKPPPMEPQMKLLALKEERHVQSGNGSCTPHGRRDVHTKEHHAMSAAEDLAAYLDGKQFGTILADPPWRFTNRTGKIAPEHRRLSRYGTLSLDQIASLPIADHTLPAAHCYIWCPNALLPDGLRILKEWGFEYKTNLIWHKIRKDGGPDGRGVGFYFRNVTEMVLFGVRGKNARTLDPGRSQVNFIATRKREHSRNPDEQYAIIESCSRGPYLELFGRGKRTKWCVWGDQAKSEYQPDWPTYAYNSASVVS